MPESPLPAWLRAAAQPRWSHRDPVANDNPFPTSDPHHDRWQRATDLAIDELRRHDERLNEVNSTIINVASYRSQMIELAATRFDTWACRGLATIDKQRYFEGYASWLQNYVNSWLDYAAATCRPVAVHDDLRARLTKRAMYSTAEAKALVNQDPDARVEAEHSVQRP